MGYYSFSSDPLILVYLALFSQQHPRKRWKPEKQPPFQNNFLHPCSESGSRRCSAAKRGLTLPSKFTVTTALLVSWVRQKYYKIHWLLLTALAVWSAASPFTQSSVSPKKNPRHTTWVILLSSLEHMELTLGTSPLLDFCNKSILNALCALYDPKENHRKSAQKFAPTQEGCWFFPQASYLDKEKVGGAFMEINYNVWGESSVHMFCQ